MDLVSAEPNCMSLKHTNVINKHPMINRYNNYIKNIMK